VFDLDGTLIDSKINYEKMGAMIAEILRGHGYAGPLEDRRAVYRVIRGGEKELIENGLEGPALKEALALIEEAMDQVELEALPTNVLRSNAADTVKKLHGAGYKLGVATRSHREYTLRSLDAFSLTPYFNAIVARDDTPTPKPHPGHLLQTIRQLDAEKDRTLYIGDTTTDLETAAAAGVEFIGYWRDDAWAKRLIESGCKTMVKDLLEIVGLVESRPAA
ncbi:MAG TPA: HAD family hydrolase, partial [Candidatus Bathyarchaeia archaeon]